ncbi:diaminobutyrate acetyltransferase [Devosia beringensis]|uniref:diaminobutyrate acetyltransferase n=1 Tax=Devosia beringensis TaxID=2657486 RepID=UPI00186B721E|nr:diaminobutyrate acetyltransferase [Devosia beringensis]
MIYGTTVLSDAASLRREAQSDIRMPIAADGPAVWKLIAATPSLDKNSLYCNLLQCSHFAATCALAEGDGAVVGWLSGYVPPEQADTLFVWQVCVAEAARGQGLARRMIGNVLARPGAQSIERIACTITADNAPSWALFGSIAQALKAELAQEEHFTRAVHFDGSHDSELAVSIGPFDRRHLAALAA